MEYRRLGQTGERVSTIGMGTWKLGAYTDSEERAAQVSALRKGIELGINLIDTAEIYSGGRSEEVVGEAIKGARDRVLIATKVSPDNLRHDSVIRSCEQSLRRLGTGCVDLYQVHWPNPSVPIQETMTAMDELVRAGKVRYVGVSNFSVSQTEEARTALGKVDLVSNQVEYSLANRSAEEDILPYCVREGISLIAYSPLARGRISKSIPEAIASKYGMTPAQVMLNWATRREQVLAIPKAASHVHMIENAASVSKRFTESEYDLIGKT